MAGMSAHLKIEGKVKLKNMFNSGKTFSTCVSAPNGPGDLILAPPMMADIMPLHLDGSAEWIIGRHCFVGHTPGVQRAAKLSSRGVAYAAPSNVQHCGRLSEVSLPDNSQISGLLVAKTNAAS